MYCSKVAATILTIAASVLPACHAQAPAGTSYTDPETNTTFSTWEIPGPLGLTFGLALPDSAREVDATDFTGYLKCNTAIGWCGISLGGAMTDSLLLVTYADPNSKPETENAVAISPRYTSTYSLPVSYTGNLTITPLSAHVDESTNSFETIFTCASCLHWSQNGTEGRAKTSSGMLDLAWAISPEKPVIDATGDLKIVQHEKEGTWVALV
ncbi:hypothetical protein BJX65DRAFT_305401 [Aspergillus insuetus]